MRNKIPTVIAQAFLALTILALALVALEPRFGDLMLAYDYVTGQIFKDISSVSAPETASQPGQKEPSNRELKQDLLSFDTEIRIRAMKKIVEKKDTSFIPLLIRLFNDVSSIDSQEEGQKLTTADVARDAVIRLYRESVIRDPGAINGLIPLMDAASRGSKPEQMNAIAVIGELREPAAVGLLNDLAKNSTDKPVIIAASKALNQFSSESTQTDQFSRLLSRQSTMQYVMVVSTCLLIVFVIWTIFTGFDARLIVMALLAISINLGLAILVNAEVERAGGLTIGSARSAALSGLPILVRSKIYSENSIYPGASNVSQEMSKVCDIKTLQVLNHIEATEPDDLPGYKRLLENSRKWILSRLMITNKDKPCLENILRNADDSLCDEIVKTIDNLRVSSDRLVDLLVILSSAETENCDEAILKLYDAMQKRPVWEY